MPDAYASPKPFIVWKLWARVCALLWMSEFFLSTSKQCASFAYAKNCNSLFFFFFCLLILLYSFIDVKWIQSNRPFIVYLCLMALRICSEQQQQQQKKDRPFMLMNHGRLVWYKTTACVNFIGSLPLQTEMSSSEHLRRGGGARL